MIEQNFTGMDDNRLRQQYTNSKIRLLILAACAMLNAAWLGFHNIIQLKSIGYITKHELVRLSIENKICKLKYEIHTGTS